MGTLPRLVFDYQRVFTLGPNTTHLGLSVSPCVLLRSSPYLPPAKDCRKRITLSFYPIIFLFHPQTHSQAPLQVRLKLCVVYVYCAILSFCERYLIARPREPWLVCRKSLYERALVSRLWGGGGVLGEFVRFTSSACLESLMD